MNSNCNKCKNKQHEEHWGMDACVLGLEMDNTNCPKFESLSVAIEVLADPEYYTIHCEHYRHEDIIERMPKDSEVVLSGRYELIIKSSLTLGEIKDIFKPYAVGIRNIEQALSTSNKSEE